MTIATRNRFIRLATLVSFALTITALVSLFLILTHHLLPLTPPGHRAFHMLNKVFLTKYSPLASAIAICIFPFFSLAGLLFILFSFEKTQTVEITFFAACIFVMSLESLRMFIPLYQLWMHANFLSATISRVVLCSRIFILLAILSSAIFTTGGTIQQVGPSLFLLAFFSMSLSNVIPINSGSITATFIISSGFRIMLDAMFLLIGSMGVLSYLVLGKTRGIPEYTAAGGGIALLLPGYAILNLCDSWFFLACGIILLVTGTWRYLDRIHRYYLWQ